VFDTDFRMLAGVFSLRIVYMQFISQGAIK
jgi:hypothetical protein